MTDPGRLDRLFAEALDRPDDERAAFVAALSAEDPNLGREITALLRAVEESEDYLDDPADWLGEISEAPLPGPWPDRTVSHYEILEPLGAGGMGRVFKARDTRLDRLVTLKFLHAHLSRISSVTARFEQEARAASALDHPNICTIHEIGEAPDGQLFIAMAYYAGETLKDRLARGPLPQEEVLRIGRAIATGLQAAHEAGIVHRDLKPANVMLTERGDVKILDFGVAKLEGAAPITASGARLGTLAYASPEQARGKSVDHRTDIWSLGVVLAEMLAGARPFHGDSDAALVHSIIHDEPTLAMDLPPDVERVIRVALARTPANRFPSMTACGDALDALGEGRAPALPKPAVDPHRRARSIGLLLAVIVVAALGTWLVTRSRGGDVATARAGAGAPPAATIAVLPFDVVGTELADWREGLAHLLSIGLDGAAGVRAIDRRTLLARWDALDPGATGPDRRDRLRLADELDARFALLGSAVVIGTEARLVADVYDVGDRTRLDQRQVEGHPDSLLTLADRLAVEVLGVVLETGDAGVPPVGLASITTTSIPALKSFLEGEVLFRRSELEGAVEAYSRALEADSTFALAHFHLASAWDWLENIQHADARRHRAAALRYLDRLPERDAALVRARHATGEQQAEAVALLRAAVERHPDDAEAWFLLGDAHLHTAAPTGPAEADSAFRRAVELDPAFAPYQPHLVELAFNLHADSALAVLRLEQYERVAGDSAYSRAGRFAMDLAFGNPATRSAALVSLAGEDLDLLPNTVSFVQHPGMWRAQEGILRAMRDRRGPSPAWVTTSADVLASELLWKGGRLGEALNELRHPAVSLVTRVCLPAVARGWDLPIADTVLEPLLLLGAADARGPVHFVLACQGYIAADLGRWEDHAARLLDLDERARLARDGGDARSAELLDAAAAEVRAYGMWRRGDPDGALRGFERARRVAWYLGEWPRRVHRKSLWYPNVWPGMILQETQRPAEAVPWFRLPWYNPLAQYREGQVAEALGNLEGARVLYTGFIEAWAEADPQLEHLVEDARRALAGMGSGP